MDKGNFLLELAKHFYIDLENVTTSPKELHKKVIYWSSKVVLNLEENAYDWETNLYYLSRYSLSLLLVKFANGYRNDLFKLLVQFSKTSFNDDGMTLAHKLASLYDHPVFIACLPDLVVEFTSLDKFIDLLPYIKSLHYIRILYCKDSYPKLWLLDNAYVPDTVIIHKAFDELGKQATYEVIRNYYLKHLPTQPKCEECRCENLQSRCNSKE